MELYLRLLQTSVNATPALKGEGQAFVNVLKREWKRVKAERKEFRGVREQLPPVDVVGNAVERLEDGDSDVEPVINNDTNITFEMTMGVDGVVNLTGTTPEGKEFVFELVGSGSKRNWSFKSDDF